MATVIRKVRTPEGALRYGQPIGTVITKDMQIKAGLRFLATPFTVQYGLGVLNWQQLQKVASKNSTADVTFPDGWTQIVPKAAKDAHLDSLWGLVLAPDNTVFRWDRRPDGAIIRHTVTKSQLSDAMLAQLPDDVKFAEQSRLGPDGMEIPPSQLWLDSKHMPDSHWSTGIVGISESDLVAEGDDAPGLTPKPEPQARWQKVDSHTTVKALTAKIAKDGAGTPVNDPQRLFFDGQSVGLVVKVKADNGTQQWRMYRNGELVTTGATKAGVLDTATQQWMDGQLLPDGKATLASGTAEATELGADTGIVPSVSDDLAALEDALETPDTDLPAPRTPPNVEPDTLAGVTPGSWADMTGQGAVLDGKMFIEAQEIPDDATLAVLVTPTTTGEASGPLGLVTHQVSGTQVQIELFSGNGPMPIYAADTDVMFVSAEDYFTKVKADVTPVEMFTLPPELTPGGKWQKNSEGGWTQTFPTDDPDQVWEVEFADGEIIEVKGKSTWAGPKGAAKKIAQDYPNDSGITVMSLLRQKNLEGYWTQLADSITTESDAQVPADQQLFAAAIQQLFPAQSLPTDPLDFSELNWQAKVLVLRTQASSIEPWTQEQAQQYLEKVEATFVERKQVAQTLGAPGFSAVSIAAAQKWLATHSLADIPKKPDQVWAVLDAKQRDDLLEAALGGTSPSALLMLDDWNAMGFSAAEALDLGAKTQTGPVYPVKPAGFATTGTLITLNPGGIDGLDLPAAYTALVFDEKYNAHNPYVSKAFAGTELEGLSGALVFDDQGNPDSLWYYTVSGWVSSPAKQGWPLDGTSGQTMILGTDLAKQDPAFEMDIDALKSPLAITIPPVVPTPVAAAPGVPKVTFALTTPGEPIVDIPSDAVMVYSPNVDSGTAVFDQHLVGYIRLTTAPGQTPKVAYTSLMSPDMPMSTSELSKWDENMLGFQYVPLASFTDAYIAVESVDGLGYATLTEALDDQLQTTTWKQTSWWDASPVQFPDSVADQLAQKLAMTAPVDAVLAPFEKPQAGEGTVTGYALLADHQVVGFSVDAKGTVTSTWDASASDVVWEIKEIEVGQSSMYHLDASSDFEKLKAWKQGSLLDKVVDDYKADPLSEYVWSYHEGALSLGGVQVPQVINPEIDLEQAQPLDTASYDPPMFVKYQGLWWVLGDPAVLMDAQNSGQQMYYPTHGYDVDQIIDQVTGADGPQTEPVAIQHLPGGVDATPAQIQQALDILLAAKGMMIKQPLAKADNPLAGTDYHAMAAPYLDSHAGEKFKTKLAYLDALKALLADKPKKTKKAPEGEGLDFADPDKITVTEMFGPQGMQTSLLGGTSIPMTATLIYDPSAPSASDDDLPEWNKGLVGWVYKDANDQYVAVKLDQDITAQVFGDEAFALGDQPGFVYAPAAALATGDVSAHTSVLYMTTMDEASKASGKGIPGSSPDATGGLLFGTPSSPALALTGVTFPTSGQPVGVNIVLPPDAVLVYVENVPSFAVPGSDTPEWNKGLAGWVIPGPDGTYTSAVSLLNGVVEQVSPKDALFTHEYSTKHFVPAQVIIDAKGQFQAGELPGHWQDLLPAPKKKTDIPHSWGVSLPSDGSGTLQVSKPGKKMLSLTANTDDYVILNPQKTAIVGAVKVTDGKITWAAVDSGPENKLWLAADPAEVQDKLGSNPVVFTAAITTALIAGSDAPVIEPLTLDGLLAKTAPGEHTGMLDAPFEITVKKLGAEGEPFTIPIDAKKIIMGKPGDGPGVGYTVSSTASLAPLDQPFLGYLGSDDQVHFVNGLGMTGSEYQQNYGGSFTVVDPAAFKNAVMVGGPAIIGSDDLVEVPGPGALSVSQGNLVIGTHPVADTDVLMYDALGTLRGFVEIQDGTILSHGVIMDTGAVEVHGAYPPSSWLEGHAVSVATAKPLVAQGTYVPEKIWAPPVQVLAAPGTKGTQSPLHPFTPPPAGRWGKKGTKGYLDVYSDGSGAWTTAGGKTTPQTKAQVSARIGKGLSLQVAADPWPHHGQVGRTYVVAGQKVGSPQYTVHVDGSVTKRVVDPVVTDTELTAQEFAQEIASLLDQGEYLTPQMVGTWYNSPENQFLHLPLFPDRKAFEEFAKAHPVTLFSAGTGQKGEVVLQTADDVDAFLTALDSSEAWAAWVNAHDKVIGGAYPGATPSTLTSTYYLNMSPSWMRKQILESFGESLPTHTPSQQGRYAESGPFWVNTGTDGVFAPVGAVREVARGRARVDWLKAGEMSSLMSEISADLGLTGILFAKKGGFNKGQKQQWLYAFQRGDFAKIKELEKQSGNDNPLLDSLPDSVAWEAAIPSEVSPLTAVPGSWSSVDTYMMGSVSPAEVDNYLIAAKMAHPDMLTVEEKMQWAKFHRQHMVVASNNLSLVARNRFVAGDAPKSSVPVWTDGLTAKKSYEAEVATQKMFTGLTQSWSTQQTVWGSFYSDEFAGHTPAQVKAKYPGHDAFIDSVADTQLSGGKFITTSAVSLAVLQQAQQKHQAWLDAQAKIPVLSIPPTKNPKLKKDHSTHPVSFVKDQFGNDWIFKQMPEKFRVDIETMATQVANLYGFDFPEVLAVTDPSKHHLGKGKIGFAQRYAPNKGSMQQLGLTATDLDQTQLVDVALDHVLDWLIDNDDGHAGNFLVGDDGHLIPIDKARTMKHYGVWKGLSGDYHADSNASLISTQMFQGIADHQISEADAQAAYRAAIKKAREIQDADWAPLEALITEAMADRTQWYPASTPQNTAQLLAKVKARKAQMVADIESVWSTTFKKAGYALPPVPAPPKNGRYHAVDAQFDVNLGETKILGQSVMVAGPLWEDGHFHIWQEYVGGSADNGWKGSKPLVRGQGYLMGPKKKQLYDDLYDAAELKESPGITSSPQTQVTSDLAQWRNEVDLEFIELAKKHSNKVLGKDSGAAVTPEQVKALATKTKKAWAAKKKQLLKDYPTGAQPGQKLNPAYLDAFDARVDQWVDQMTTELTQAIAEDRKVKREPLYKPEFPVLSSPLGPAGMTSLWNTWYDKYNASYEIKPGDPKYTEPPDLPPLYIETDVQDAPDVEVSVFEQRFPELAAMGVTLKVRKIKATSGELSQSQLELHSKSGSGQSAGWDGYEYVLKLPSGEEVMVAAPSKTVVSDGTDNAAPWAKVPYGHPTLASRQGMVRFQGNPGQSASQTWAAVKPVLDSLEPVNDPTDTDLEILYYRMMVGMFQNRKSPSKKHKQLIQAGRLKAQELGLVVPDYEAFDPSILDQVMTQDEQQAFWREQFSALVGKATFDGFLKADGWRPRFESDVTRSNLPVGHPYWYRVDADPVALVTGDRWLYQGGMPARPMVYTGLQSTDERVRILGFYKAGASSGTDQENGAGTVAYTRSGAVGQHGSSSVILSPLTAMRIGVYGFDHDGWGKPWQRQSGSYLDVDQMLHSSGYETMVKWAVGVENAYAVQCANTSERARILAELKKLGVTQIGGVPVEDIFVVGNLAAAAKKAKKIQAEAIKKQIAEKGWL